MKDRGISRKEYEEMVAFLEKYERETPPAPEGLEVPPKFAYIRCKAYRYLTFGAAAYREQDALHRPPADWPPPRLAAVARGCEQILQWRGLTPESALEGIGIDGFYALLRVFHFECEAQSARFGEDGTALDRMQMRHVVDGETLVLFNRVRMGGQGGPAGDAGRGAGR